MEVFDGESRGSEADAVPPVSPCTENDGTGNWNRVVDRLGPVIECKSAYVCASDGVR